MSTPSKTTRAALLTLVLLLVAQIWAVPAAVGQSEPVAVFGLEFEPELTELMELPWVDPIEQFELVDEPLAAVPDFDFEELHPSEVFEEGVENIAVADEADVVEETERHLRALQTVATAELARVTVDQNIASAESSITRATQDIATSRDTIADLERQISIANREIQVILSADLIEVEAQAQLNTEINRYRKAIVEIAIQAFTGEDMAVETLFTDPESTAILERQVVSNQVREHQREEIEDREFLVFRSDEVRKELEAERLPLEAANTARETEIADTRRAIEVLIAERERLENSIVDLEDRGEVLDTTIETAVEFTAVTAAHYQVAYHQRLESFVDGSDVPLVALNAYVRATRTLAETDPGCGIHWSQLAGIGRIESFHGYFGDSTLDVNGQTTEDIRGLALDGRILSGPTTGTVPDATGRTEETAGVSRLALIRDTDNGFYDGDRTFDRAVGPMQFIPSTWRLFTSDGNDDGESDPQNIYDSSLAAATYLCDAAGSMLTTDGEQRGYFAYNHDLTYSANVTQAGRGYHEQLDVAPESGAFANFAVLPTPSQIAAAEALAFEEAEAAEAEANGELVDGDQTGGLVVETAEEKQGSAPVPKGDGAQDVEVLSGSVEATE